MINALSRRHCLQALVGLGLLVLAPAPSGPTRLNWRGVKALVRQRFPSVANISVPELKQWLDNAERPPPLLIDVRTEQEFSDGHIEGAIRAESTDAALRLLSQRGAGVAAVLYCSVGYRSSALASALQKEGVSSVYNLEGSLFEWANAGKAVVSSQGKTGRVHPYDRQWGVLLLRSSWSREP